MIIAHILTPLEDLLRTILEWLGPHGTVGLTWAWSIVALTVIVRLLMVPLAPSRNANPAKCRPIGCYQASKHLADQYRRDR